jgi:hypothetical protein
MRTSKRVPNEFRETTNEDGTHPPEKKLPTNERKQRMKTGLLCAEKSSQRMKMGFIREKASNE